MSSSSPPPSKKFPTLLFIIQLPVTELNIQYPYISNYSYCKKNTENKQRLV
jgi:hypothetical protein